MDRAEVLRRRRATGSPCVDVCEVDPTARLCRGCLRSPDEIAAWGRLSPEERAAVLAVLPGRAGLLAP